MIYQRLSAFYATATRGGKTGKYPPPVADTQGDYMENELKGVVINPETGEVDNELYEGDRIVRKRSDQYLEETVEFKISETFAKVSFDVLPDVIDALNPQECKMLFVLMRYLRKDSGVLKYKNGKPVTIDNIVNSSKIAKRTAERAMQGLRQKDIVQSIHRPQGRFLLLNPYIVMNGRRIDRTCYDIFYKSRWATKGNRNGNN